MLDYKIAEKLKPNDELIRLLQNLFNYYYGEDKDFEYACSRICFLVMLGNINEFKNILKNIK